MSSSNYLVQACKTISISKLCVPVPNYRRNDSNADISDGKIESESDPPPLFLLTGGSTICLKEHRLLVCRQRNATTARLREYPKEVDRQ